MPRPIFNPMAGTLVAVNFEFLDDVGDPADPTAVIVRVRTGGGATRSPAATKLGVGLYRAEFIVDEGGTWAVLVEGQGALIVVDELQFEVRTPVVAYDG